MGLKAGILACLLTVGVVTGAQAATVAYATNATIVTDVPVRNTANNRHIIENALGSTLGNFFELGYGGVVDFTFGGRFYKSVTITEVTFGNRALSAMESVEVWGGLNGKFVKLTTVNNRTATPTIALNGRQYDTLRLVDTTPIARGTTTGGYDVDRIAVAPVPVPAAGALLLTGLAGLIGLKRRRMSA